MFGSIFASQHKVNIKNDVDLARAVDFTTFVGSCKSKSQLKVLSLGYIPQKILLYLYKYIRIYSIYIEYVDFYVMSTSINY